jgi:hypothetical protein
MVVFLTPEVVDVAATYNSQAEHLMRIRQETVENLTEHLEFSILD